MISHAFPAAPPVVWRRNSHVTKCCENGISPAIEAIVYPRGVKMICAFDLGRGFALPFKKRFDSQICFERFYYSLEICIAGRICASTFLFPVFSQKNMMRNFL
ncbi:hypothetical protein XU18_2279 [Perkinsela sp. CCAP 1560/4]|nr:hypothetical protein XU18_2279 [Perkinsela sp. CCAP 1560/4]|eukprot:KNH07008.1 hypothetical protein XU18_2279 [Perkinsela sp. CCAP 1560/4]